MPCNDAGTKPVRFEESTGAGRRRDWRDEAIVPSRIQIPAAAIPSENAGSPARQERATEASRTAGAARVDRAFPREGDPAAVRKHQRGQQANVDGFRRDR